jgi:hypothetical protein
MPATQSLQWVDVNDFTPGLWDQDAAYNKFATPPNAFRTLDDYMPVKGGGLRPAPLAQPISLTGGPPVGSTIMGVFARGGVARTGAGTNNQINSDIIVVTMGSNFKFTIWRLDNTVTVPAWSSRFVSAVNVDDFHTPVQFAYFQDTNGVMWYLMSIETNGAVRGLYSMRVDLTVASNTGNDGLVAKISGDYGPLCVSQARIMVGTGGGEGAGGAVAGNQINYSDVGLTTFSGSTHGSLIVTSNRTGSSLTAISGVEPSDLLIAKSGAPWVEINGDIASVSTPVREMGDDHHARVARQQLPKTPNGVCFIEPNGRVFETDGRNFKALTNQLAARSLIWSHNMVAPGILGYVNGFLFIPGTDDNTNGYVFDFESDALFRTTGINPVFSYLDGYDNLLYCANHDPTAPTLVTYYFGGGFDQPRTSVTTGVIQTVPFADKNGRNIDIREVQMYVLCNAATEFKVELINESGASVATRYAVIDTGRQDMFRVQFPATKSGYLSIKITPRTYDGVSEAPTFERLRIGFGVNNLVRVG